MIHLKLCKNFKTSNKLSWLRPLASCIISLDLKTYPVRIYDVSKFVNILKLDLVSLLELEAIHASAPATAVIYVISVLVIYLVGLCLILIHHMNSAYGRWAWSLSDARDELKPLWSWADWKGNNVRSTQKRRTTSGSGTRKRLQKRTR